MTTLAPELLHLIVSQVALAYVYYPDQKEYRKDLGTLRSLRLANQELCNVASEYLFEEVTLYFTEASHVKLMAIAQHPTYSACVRTIGIAPKAIFGPYIDRTEFGQWFCHERCLVMGDGYSEGCFMKPHRMSYLPTGESKVIDFHHAEYTLLYRKQEQLSAKAGEFLKTAVGCFSRLERVESSVRTPSTAYPVPSTNDAFISDIWQESACLYKYDLEHSVMILTAVSQGRSLAATQVDVSQLFYKMDTLVMDAQEPVTSGQILRLVADAKKINLSVQTADFAGLRQLINTSKCARFLGLMRDLESLSCTTYELQGSPLSYPSLRDIIGNKGWPHLHRLYLGRFHTSASKLVDFFGCHRPTLQELELQDIVLSEGSWYEVFVKARKCALRIIKIHRLGCRKNHEYFLSDTDEHCLGPLPYKHPLHAFLFRAGPWVPNMVNLLEGISHDYGTDSEATDSEEDDEQYEEDHEQSEEDMSDE